MKITVATVWYNEEIFAPFFLTHYNYVDKIHIFLDADTHDNTEEMCKQYDNVEIEKVVYPNHLYSDRLIVGIVNRFVSSLKSDWVYVLGSDEFIFPHNGESARAILKRQSANLLRAQMEHVWRHRTETDLDSSKPSVYQRRHGELPNYHTAKYYNKPIIAKPESLIQWKRGAHSYHRKNNNIQSSEENFMGTHWKHADLGRAIAKRIERLERMHGDQNVDYDREKRKLTMEVEAHLDDPQLF